MKSCNYCIKEIEHKAKFCKYCGKKQEINNTKPQIKNINNTVISIFVGVVLTIFVIFLIIALKQRDYNQTTTELDLALSEEATIGISEQPKYTLPNIQKRKEGYTDYEKPFDEGNYE